MVVLRLLLRLPAILEVLIVCREQYPVERTRQSSLIPDGICEAVSEATDVPQDIHVSVRKVNRKYCSRTVERIQKKTTHGGEVWTEANSRCPPKE